PIRGSPAYKAGLMTGDLITQITREVDAEGNPLNPPEVTETRGMTVNDAVKKLTGKPGTKVKLSVRREGVGRSLEFEVAGAAIESETVFGVKRNDDDSWAHWLDKEKRIAYIRISQLGSRTPADLTAALGALRKEGMRALVLDLRENTGGL